MAIIESYIGSVPSNMVEAANSDGGTACNRFSITTGGDFRSNVLKCGERVEIKGRRIEKNRVYWVGLEYFFPSNYPSQHEYDIIMQHATYFEGMPGGWFDSSRGGCGALGSYIIRDTNSDRISFQFQRPTADQRVLCTKHTMALLPEVRGKRMGVVLHFKTATDTTGFMKVWRRIQGETDYTQILNEQNTRITWSSFPNGGYFKFGLYKGRPNWSGSTVNEVTLLTAKYRLGDGQSVFDDVRPDQ